MIKEVLNEKRLLVAGGTGFIGRYAVIKGVNSGYQVTVIARKLPIDSEKIQNVDYISADIANYHDVYSAIGLKKFTHVINLSGNINHATLENGGKEVIESHFIGLMNLIRSLNRDFLQSFVQIGSSDEYGNCDAPQNEDHECSPSSNYAFAKLCANNFLMMLHKTEQFPAIMVRLFLVFGPKQNSQRFLPQVIRSCLADKNFSVSKGEQLRDFCFVEDAVDGIFFALESKELFGNIFNIASGKPIKIKDMVNRIISLIGTGHPVFGAIPYRENENMHLYANVSKANKFLNWKASANLVNSLNKTIDYYRSLKSELK